MEMKEKYKRKSERGGTRAWKRERRERQQDKDVGKEGEGKGKLYKPKAKCVQHCVR